MESAKKKRLPKEPDEFVRKMQYLDIPEDVQRAEHKEVSIKLEKLGKPPAPPSETLGFDWSVKETVMRMAFAGQAVGPPAKGDSNELKEDKMFYHKCKLEAVKWRSDEYAAHRDSLYNWFNREFPGLCETNRKLEHHNELNQIDETQLLLVGVGTIETPMAELLKLLHNVYHLDAYIMQVLKVNAPDSADMGSRDVWKLVATEQWHNKPISQWPTTSFHDVVDNISKLYLVYEKSKTLFSNYKKRHNCHKKGTNHGLQKCSITNIHPHRLFLNLRFHL